MHWLKLPAPDHCPRCRYSLRGLPPAHRCPECGFPYGGDTVVWGLEPDDTGEQQANRGRTIRRNMVRLPLIAIATFFGTVAVLGALQAHFRMTQTELTYALFGTAFLFAVLWRVLLGQRRQHVYLNVDGIDVVAGRRWMHIDWQEVLEVVREDNTTVIDVKSGRATPISLHSVEHDDYLPFRDEIVCRRDTALAQPPSAPDGGVKK